MLEQRIISTLRFFDLQDTPLTLLELHKFLLNDLQNIKSGVDAEFEFLDNQNFSSESQAGKAQAGMDEIIFAVDNGLNGQVESKNGYYCLPGRANIIDSRLENYLYGFGREKRIKRYAGFLRHIPFVRGAGLGGSQALGQQKSNSDIDLLIITGPKFMWLARTLVSFYFQIFGVRRHQKITANRFCLNHYLARPKKVDRERNLYKAMEYARLRPLVYSQNIAGFQKNNLDWISFFFPNFNPPEFGGQQQPGLQKNLEKLFLNSFGRRLENWLLKIETRRIKQDRYTFITADELSFHPDSRHGQLLQNFFQAADD